MAEVASIMIKDNSKKYKKMFEEAIKDICESIGSMAEGYAKDNCPVDTGRLRSSITYATESHSGFSYNYKDDEGKSFSYSVDKTNDKNSVFIGSSVNYAEENELYNPNGKSHFLRNAATQHSPEYKAVVIARMNA